MTEHARLGASNSSQWLNCTGSPAMNEGRTSKTSKYAAEGSVAHVVADMALRDEPLPKEVEHEGFEFKVDRDMLLNVQVYLDEIERLRAKGLHKEWIEQRVTLDDLWTAKGETPPEPLFGTADYMMLTVKNATLYVRDLKYGKGVGVEVKGNTQLLYYGLGALLQAKSEDWSVSIVDVGIVQPRYDHPDGAVRSLKIDAKDLMAWGASLKKIVDDIHKGNTSLVTGGWCRWCPSKGSCTAHHDGVVSDAKIVFDDLPIIGQMDNAELDHNLIEVTETLGRLKALHEGMTDEAIRRLAGDADAFDHWALVGKRGLRTWIDKRAVLEDIRDMGLNPKDYADVKLKSPAQIERMLAAETGGDFARLKQYIEIPDRGQKLARRDDLRDGDASAAAEAFDD